MTGERGVQEGRAAVCPADGRLPGHDSAVAGSGAPGRAGGAPEKRRRDADEPSSKDVGTGAFPAVLLG